MHTELAAKMQPFVDRGVLTPELAGVVQSLQQPVSEHTVGRLQKAMRALVKAKASLARDCSERWWVWQGNGKPRDDVMFEPLLLEVKSMLRESIANN